MSAETGRGYKQQLYYSVVLSLVCVVYRFNSSSVPSGPTDRYLLFVGVGTCSSDYISGLWEILESDGANDAEEKITHSQLIIFV